VWLKNWSLKVAQFLVCSKVMRDLGSATPSPDLEIGPANGRHVLGLRFVGHPRRVRISGPPFESLASSVTMAPGSKDSDDERETLPDLPDDLVESFFARPPESERAPYVAPPQPKVKTPATRRPARAKEEELQRKPVPRFDPDEIDAYFASMKPAQKPTPPDRTPKDGVRKADKGGDEGTAKRPAKTPSEAQQKRQTRSAAKAAGTGT
jgi:hypothetical protein